MSHTGLNLCFSWHKGFPTLKHFFLLWKLSAVLALGGLVLLFKMEVIRQTTKLCLNCLCVKRYPVSWTSSRAMPHRTPRVCRWQPLGPHFCQVNTSWPSIWEQFRPFPQPPCWEAPVSSFHAETEGNGVIYKHCTSSLHCCKGNHELGERVKEHLREILKLLGYQERNKLKSI